MGYTHATINLLDLVPLVELAWIDGDINPAERAYIFAAASECGIEENTPARRKLLEWLEHRPWPDFFEGTERIIREALQSLPEKERLARTEAIVEACIKFVQATGTHLAWITFVPSAKRELLHDIARRLNVPACAARSA